jgi:hypothetical protein
MSMEELDFHDLQLCTFQRSKRGHIQLVVHFFFLILELSADGESVLSFSTGTGGKNLMGLSEKKGQAGTTNWRGFISQSSRSEIEESVKNAY